MSDNISGFFFVLCRRSDGCGGGRVGTRLGHNFLVPYFCAARLVLFVSQSGPTPQSLSTVRVFSCVAKFGGISSILTSYMKRPLKNVALLVRIKGRFIMQRRTTDSSIDISDVSWPNLEDSQALQLSTTVIPSTQTPKNE